MILIRSIACSLLLALAWSQFRRRKAKAPTSTRPEPSTAGSGESASLPERDYEVFLSFGPDTRLTIADSLHAAMIRAGIRVFKDDEELRIGEDFRGEVLRAITNSKIYVPIFSRGYASSRRCLCELTFMMERRRKKSEKVILPIFYDVGAGDVRLNTRTYHDALRKHERESGKEVVKQWEAALRKVARIMAWNLSDHGLDKLVGLILEEVFSKLRIRQLNVRNDLVGIHDPMEAIKELFGQAASGVRFVVIHGMGGVGKTTLAKAIFEQMSPQFQEHCSFLSDVRQSSRDNGILNLQKKLLCDILGLRSITLFDAYDGINHIKERLCEKKVLIVLDDMDDREQLKKLAGKSSWFGLGSRIIITTRNIPFLASDDDSPDETIPVHPRDFYFYEMKEMQPNHALQLFSKHAFESDSPPPDYGDISSKVVTVTGGLPLTLEVVGSYLCGKNMVIWIDTWKKLKKVPHNDVLQKLMVSYEKLEDDQRQIFLDIACYFIGEERVLANYMWKACDFYPKSGILVLIQLSLIKIVDGDKLWMHDQLRDLGREIIRQECLQDPGKRSRLWCPTTAFDVVTSKGGTENLVALKLAGLPLKHYFLEHCFTSEEFSRLPNLRFLELDGGNLVGDFTGLLSKLTWLCWHRCPPYLHATSLFLRSLAVLKLSKSDITEDWLGWGPCMGIGKLEVVHLSSCNHITKTPDFSSCLNLKRLIFEECEHLAYVDGSINKLEHLKQLGITAPLRLGITPILPLSLPVSISGLKSLLMLKIENKQVQELPPSIGDVVGLKYLSLSGCRGFRKLPDSIGGLKSLLEMDLSMTGIASIPDSTGNLKMLKVIKLNGCWNLSELPDSISRLESLCKLEFSNTNITRLPDSIGNLKGLEVIDSFYCRIRRLPDSIGGLESLLKLIMDKGSITELPDYIRNLKKLKCLMLGKNLREIPKAIGMLESLEELRVGCTMEEIPSEIGQLFSLRIIDLSGSKVRRLPTTIGQLSHLKELILCDCNGLQQLPELPASLTKLELSPLSLEIVPDLSNMTNLVHLKIICGIYKPVIYQVQAQTPKDWLERFTLPPTNLSSLSRLRQLIITCPDPRSLTQLPSSLEELTLVDVRSPIEWSLFSTLTKLSFLTIRGCQLREIHFDVTGQLENLHHLQVEDCGLLARLSSLSSLKELRELSLNFCPQLDEIQSSVESEFSATSSIGGSGSVESLSDASKLQKLEQLRIIHCQSLQDLSDLPKTCSLWISECPKLYDGHFRGLYEFTRKGGRTSHHKVDIHSRETLD